MPHFMRKTCLDFGSSVASNPYIGDKGRQAAIESRVPDFQWEALMLALKKPLPFPTTSSNDISHCNNSICCPYYAGFRPRISC